MAKNSHIVGVYTKLARECWAAAKNATPFDAKWLRRNAWRYIARAKPERAWDRLKAA